MIRKKKAAFFTILWIAVMAVIFAFSSDDAEASGAKSGAVVTIVETIEETFHITPTQEARDLTETVVRKCAHVFLYTCLGVTGTLAVREYAEPLIFRCRHRRRLSAEAGGGSSGEENRKIPAWLCRGVTAIATYLLCFLYACTDEWHQTFRQGRSGSFRDVWIDSIGVVLGIGIVTLASAVRKHAGNRKPRKDSGRRKADNFAGRKKDA